MRDFLCLYDEGLTEYRKAQSEPDFREEEIDEEARAFLCQGERLMKNFNDTVRFYAYVPHDIVNFENALLNFEQEKLSNLKKRDEANFAKAYTEFFLGPRRADGVAPFVTVTEYGRDESLPACPVTISARQSLAEEDMEKVRAWRSASDRNILQLWEIYDDVLTLRILLEEPIKALREYTIPHTSYRDPDERTMFTLRQPPPKLSDWQDYIVLAKEQRDVSFFLHFLHYYEPVLNTRAAKFAERYDLTPFFADLKMTEKTVMRYLEEIEARNPFVDFYRVDEEDDEDSTGEDVTVDHEPTRGKRYNHSLRLRVISEKSLGLLPASEYFFRFTYCNA